MEPEILKQQAKRWLEVHENHLPLNIDSWEIIVMEKQPSSDLSPLYFGKYESKENHTESFYKRLSRIVIIEHE